MSGPRYQISNDGQTVDAQDFNLFAEEASKSEDWVFAEMLKLAPFTTTAAYAKALLPSYSSGLTGAPQLIQPTTGGVIIWPFRVAVGARINANAVISPTDPALDTVPMLAYRDVRSAVFASNTTTSLGTAGSSVGVTFANGDPTNSRWDLVYCTLAVDQAPTTSTIFVKPPGANVGAPTSVARNIVQAITFGVVTGTAGVAPALPSAPADTTSTFVFPLAYVRIPPLFTVATALQTNWIANAAPIVSLTSNGFGVAGGSGSSISAMVSNSATVGTQWGNTGTRPLWLMSPMMGAGGKNLIVTLDATGAANAWNIPDAGIVDNSIDWRNRYFLVMTAFGIAANFTFAQAHGLAAQSQAIPSLTTNAGDLFFATGQSFIADDNAALGITTRNGAVIAICNNARASGWTAATVAALYVDTTTGVLKMYGTGTPARKAAFYVFASGQMENV